MFVIMLEYFFAFQSENAFLMCFHYLIMQLSYINFILAVQFSYFRSKYSNYIPSSNGNSV